MKKLLIDKYISFLYNNFIGDIMDIDIDEINNRFIKYNKNNIYLTGEQIDILNQYNVDYKSCKSINELIYLIDSKKDDDNYDDLDWVQLNLSEFNYYHNVNK